MYKTMQYKALLGFFQQGNKEQYSSEEIIDALEPQGVGKSTLYRQLARMTEAGELRRFHEGKKVYYQFAHKRASCAQHFHLKCEGCGRLIHLDCPEMLSFAGHVAAEHGFTLNMGNTVLYGKCDKCRSGLQPAPVKG